MLLVVGSILGWEGEDEEAKHLLSSRMKALRLAGLSHPFLNQTRLIFLQ